MLILGIDFESTWQEEVDPSSCGIIEVGAVLYDTDRGCPTKMISELTWDYDKRGKPEIEEGTTEITGITTKDMYYGISTRSVLKDLIILMSACDYVCAHNGTFFDKILLESECKRYELQVPDKVWIDTMIDVDYPEKIQTRRLTYLAAEHGILNSFSHRALFDTLTMLKVLSMYDLDEVVESAKQKLYRVVANVSFAKKDLAKRRGYYWNPEEKIWYKNLKEGLAELEKGRAPFPVTLSEI